jgi:hypothetical protein
MMLVCASAQAGIKGRHIRVENPTGWMMEWRQIEVYRQGANIVRNGGEMFSGTVWPDHNVKTRSGRDMTDGNRDPKQRGIAFVDHFDDSTGERGMNPWFEIDLGAPTDIERIVLCAGRWPEKTYLDKGHRIVTILDEERRVVWAEKFDYYDKTRSDAGLFTFEPKTGERSPAIGRRIPANTGPWTPMSWLLNADDVAPLPDAAARAERFAQRNSPAEVKALADTFVPLLDARIAEMAEVHRLHSAGRHQAALDAWKVYWFAKMKRANLHWAFRGEYWTYPTQGDDLVNGIGVTISPSSARAIRFTPGQIHWIDLPPRDNPGFRNAMIDAQQKAEVNKMARPLLDAYASDPQAAYVRRWAEIMDDWSMNFFADASKCPYEVEDLFTFNPGLAWQKMMEDLSDVAVKQPSLIESLPATTLARVQMVCLEKYATAWWRQARETVFNHNCGGIALYYQVSFYIDEFHPGKRTHREFRQAFERFMTLGTLRDGSLTEIGDEGHQEIPIQLGSFLTHCDQTKPAWYTPGWRNRAMEWYDNLFTYMFRHLSPGGYEHRFAVDYRPVRWTSTHAQYGRDRAWLPPLPDRDRAVLGIAEVRRMLDAWGHVSAGRPEVTDPLLKPIVEQQQRSHDEVKKYLGDDKPGVPHINSDWMPYTGAYYFRSGWNADDAFMGMMACGSHGGSQAPQWPYSMVYHYDYNYPLVAIRPVHVDRLQPQQLFGRMNCFQPGTKTMALTQADENPAPLRWLSTDRFDFGEADFRGGYQNYPGFKGDWDGPALEQLDAGPYVENVRTIRQVFQLRKSRLFLVVDAIRTPSETVHEFSIPTILSLSERAKDASRPFTAEQLQIDERRHVLRSDNPDGPSVAVYQFADQPIEYQRDRAATIDYRKYGRRLGGEIGIAEQKTDVRLKGTNFRLVSLIASSPRGGPQRTVSVESLTTANGVGLHAKLDDGSEVWFQSAGIESAELACGPGKAKGQALLIVKSGSELSGILLGGTELTLAARRIAAKGADIQFVLGGGQIQIVDILRPIDPVKFVPDCNTFSDTQTVAMVSQTPNVEIRYTTDGTPPTLASNRYTGPIQISASTEFAARAYRLGPNGKPLPAEEFEINGTKFTVPSYGWFYKRPPKPAVAKTGLRPGLAYEYLEAPWWRLYASAHWLPAKATGVAEREMDLSSVSTHDSYGMRYKGYVNVPRSGVYTFHAPRELVNMDNAPSYDLRVFVDGEEWYLTQWQHGRGTWSIPLEAGLHRFQVDFADARTTPWRRSGIWRYYPRPWAVFQGKPSDLLISGPGLDRPSRIPQTWLFRDPEGT